MVTQAQAPQDPNAVNESGAQIESTVSPQRAPAIVSGQNNVKEQVGKVLSTDAAKQVGAGIKETVVGNIIAPLEAAGDFLEGTREAKAAQKEARAAGKEAKKAQKKADKSKLGVFDKVRKFAGRDTSAIEADKAAKKAEYQAEADQAKAKQAAAKEVQSAANKKQLNAAINLVPTPFGTVGQGLNTVRGAAKTLDGVRKFPGEARDAITGAPRQDQWYMREPYMASADSGMWTHGDLGSMGRGEYVTVKELDAYYDEDGNRVRLDKVLEKRAA